MDAEDEPAAAHGDVEGDRKCGRLALAFTLLGRLCAVAQGVAQGVEDRVLQRLQHGAVDGQIETTRDDVDLTTGFSRHVAERTRKRTEDGLGRHEGQALGLPPDPGGGRFRRGDDSGADLGELRRIAGEREERRLEAAQLRPHGVEGEFRRLGIGGARPGRTGLRLAPAKALGPAPEGGGIPLEPSQTFAHRGFRPEGAGELV